MDPSQNPQNPLAPKVQVEALPEQARVYKRPGRPKGSLNRFSRKLQPELHSPPLSVESVRECSTKCADLLGSAATRCRLACARSKKTRRA